MFILFYFILWEENMDDTRGGGRLRHLPHPRSFRIKTGIEGEGEVNVRNIIIFFFDSVN